MRQLDTVPSWRRYAASLLLVLTLVACGGANNTPPVAEAGGDIQVALGGVVQLEGSDSMDPNSDPLTYRWTFTLRPNGSTAVLEGAETAQASFTPDQLGDYELELTVSDGQATTGDSVRVTVVNNPPNADAGDDRTVTLGETVQLDGGGSSDPDGDALSFNWTFISRPTGSSTRLQGSDTQTPSFVSDVVGEYELELTVTDGPAETSDKVLITVQSDATPNRAPLADAGTDQVVLVGDTVELDGRGSTDPDEDLLTFSWHLSIKPNGSSANLDDASSRTPSFTADVAGNYSFELTVSDGEASATNTVSVRANRPPQADAGADLDGKVGEVSTVDGSTSSDPDGDSLSYQWVFVSRPAESTAALQNADAASASFTPDVEGGYILELTVSDGIAQASDRVTVTAAPEGGSVSSELYISPDGDDNNSGAESEPLKTLGAALDKAKENPEITRIRLATGSYDSEPFDYDIGKDLQIVGPDDPAQPAVLTAAADLLSITGNAFVTLVRLRLETDATAVYVSDEAGVSLVEVVCEAATCVESGRFDLSPSSPPGGSVIIVGSSLFATAADNTGHTSGVSIYRGDSVSITGSSIEGFNTGVSIFMDTPLILRDSTLSSNDTGLRVTSSASGALVDDCTFDENGYGISAYDAERVVLQNSVIVGSRAAGVQIVARSAVRLVGVAITDSDEDGLVVGRLANFTSSEVVTVRDTEITGHARHGVAVYGMGSVLDLGNESEAANNEIDSTSNNTGSGGYGYELFDARRDNADGLITLNGTELNGVEPPAGTYSGPAFILRYGLRIVYDNEVIAY